MNNTTQAILKAIAQADRITSNEDGEMEESDFWSEPEPGITPDPTQLVISFPSGDNTIYLEDLDEAEILPDGSGFRLSGVLFELFTCKKITIERQS
jgi:hypothetical protein